MLNKKNIFTYLTSFALSCSFCSNVFAEPVVSTISGSFEHSVSISINGSGFGLKSRPSPIKFDDFEDGALGQFIGNSWFIWASQEDKKPRYAAVGRPGGVGTQSAYHDFTNGNYNSTLGIVNQEVGKIYISGWFYNETSGSPSRNVKTFAFRGGNAGAWDLPNVRFDQYPLTNSGHVYVADTNNDILLNNWDVGGNLNSGSWHRVELWFDQGTLNQSNGVYNVWLDGQVWTVNSGTFTTSALPYGAFHNVYLIHYFATDEGSPMPEMKWYWDEVYIDNTLARVEIGDAPTWAACTHREIQIPLAWSDSSITVTANQGTFPNGATVYLYVLDQNGVYNSNGYPVLIGSATPPVDGDEEIPADTGDGETPTKPEPPTQLRIQNQN